MDLAGLFSSSSVVDCQFALCSIVDQLLGSRRYFICAATHLQRFPTHSARQGPAALFLFLVLCADAIPDRLERRPIQFALALCRSVHHLVIRGLTGLAGSLSALIAFRILLGVGESIYLPGGTKIVSLLFSPKERGLPSGLFDFGTRTGLVLEGILVPWLLVHFGWRRTFLILGFTALLWIAPWFWVFPRRLRALSADVAAAKWTSVGALVAPCSIAICWEYASDSFVLIITGMCWSRGCPTI